MWEFLELIFNAFDFIANIGNLAEIFVRFWRMLVSLILASIVVKIVHWLVPSRNLCLGVSIFVVIAGVILGAIWERHSA
ncbi:MAG TPA: hypothetical protein VIT91_07805 [Chthoniobacterales bacterium]